MSIDSLGRVIVGSGHFLERAPGIIAQAANIAVGGGHFDHLNHAVTQVQRVANDIDQSAGRWIRRIVDEGQYDRDYHDEVGDRLERLAQAGSDVVEAYGWAASGDLQSAWEKLVDAALKTGEVAWENVTNPPH